MKAWKLFRMRGNVILAAGLALALALIAAPAEAAGGRRGASIIITTKLRGEVAGELIAVKPDAILVLDASSADVSVDMADIHSVRIVKRSKAAVGGLLGLVVGVAGGYLGGIAAATASGACPDCEAPLAGYGFGFIGGFLGMGVGAMIGGAAGRDVTIMLDAASGPPPAAGLRRLRALARVPNYR